MARVPALTGRAFVLRTEHPTRGVYSYVRRP